MLNQGFTVDNLVLGDEGFCQEEKYDLPIFEGTNVIMVDIGVFDIMHCYFNDSFQQN